MFIFPIFSRKVSFVAVRGDSPLGDIAIDEVAISEAADCAVLKDVRLKAKDVGNNLKEGGYQGDKTLMHFK